MDIELSPISMFDRVRILSTLITDEKKIAGLTGIIYGITTPSNPAYRESIGGEIIGELSEDRAYGVHLEEYDEILWLASHLVEFIDHNAGVKIDVGQVKMVRLETGEWQEESSVGVGRKFKNYSEMMMAFEELQKSSENQRRKGFWGFLKKIIFPK